MMLGFMVGCLLPWLFFLSGVSCQCSKQDYQYCVNLANPLLNDPHFIYPDNPRDIEHVCRTWSFFVDCVKQFTDRCFTESKKQEFNKAVENPVNSIHNLCSMPDYRQDYMKHAPCMKMTLTQDSHCGRHYRHLVSQVSGEVPRSSICCSHHLFRECVLDQTKSSCEKDAAPFSAQMLDKALSFLRDQCANFQPNRIDCPGAEFYVTGGRADYSTVEEREGSSQSMSTRPLSTRPLSTRPESTRPLSTRPLSTRPLTTPTLSGGAQTTETRTSPSFPSANTPTRTSPLPWMPSTDSRTMSTSETVEWSPTEGGGARTSFGRGMSWTPEESPPWLPRPHQQDPAMRNDLDEPNQQGLGSSATSRLPLALLVSLLPLLALSR